MTAKLNCYLAEYNTLRSEQLIRLQSQNQAFNYLLIMIGATLGFIATVITKVDSPRVAQWLIVSGGLLLPLIAAPLGFIFFDNEMAVYSIGSRIHADLRPKLAAVVRDNTVLENSLAFKNLHASSTRVHRTLSIARWTLFLVPTFLPLIVVTIYATLKLQTVSIPPLLLVSVFVVFLIDVVMCAMLSRAILWAFRTLRRLHNA